MSSRSSVIYWPSVPGSPTQHHAPYELSHAKNMKPQDDRLTYWNTYYRTRGAPSIPSQFAIFVCDYLQPAQNVIEFGCGDGRDSFFFASQGYRTIGLDASEQAIALCRAKLAGQSLPCAHFDQLRVDADWRDDDAQTAAELLTSKLAPGQPTAVYARFFLHAITEEEEMAFLKLIAKLVPGGVCAVEFRTHRDFYLKKETSPHYRRYIDPLGFHVRAAQAGLAPVYFVEGFGFAKYNQDDAHVARFVLKTLPHSIVKS